MLIENKEAFHMILYTKFVRILLFKNKNKNMSSYNFGQGLLLEIQCPTLRNKKSTIGLNPTLSLPVDILTLMFKIF